MSLLARLGRPNAENRQVMIFASYGSTEQVSEERSLQKLKLKIHRRIVESMTPEEQHALATAKHENTEQVDAIISRYFERVLANGPFAVPLGERAHIVAEIRDEMLGL